MSDRVEIVLVEDNPTDAELIVRALTKHKLANHIVHLRDGAAAMSYFFGPSEAALSTPKVVLLDVKLPKVDGMEILRRLKGDQRTRDIPVVMLTSSNQKDDIQAAYQLGANSFVTKPIRYDEFSKAVSELGFYWMLVNTPPEHQPA